MGNRSDLFRMVFKKKDGLRGNDARAAEDRRSRWSILVHIIRLKLSEVARMEHETGSGTVWIGK